ncbi:nitroimidazol reductase NimA-like FMN-containing flavoprotein (pyridoxamine 5'-phosphate oxidase superfamily) [Arthrobacter sp. CG_A4]|nr:nitroimidazol reductase NimA-like FMN-containing flavoprotein (pyridoxamine 5'-phosphate oxidase superfamily) [Arthrobacter sp. CG_A4]
MGQNNEAMMFEHADDNPILNLDDEQIWKVIEGTKHGRLVVTVAGEPDIFPVNYAVSGRKLYLRTAPGNKLAQLTINSKVLFETDGILSDEAWSVVLRGTARVLDQSADIAAAEALGLKPWVPTLKDFFVEIEPTSTTGRHFQFGEHPEREI